MSTHIFYSIVKYTTSTRENCGHSYCNIYLYFISKADGFPSCNTRLVWTSVHSAWQESFYLQFISGGVTNITLKWQDAQISGIPCDSRRFPAAPRFGLIQILSRTAALMCSSTPSAGTVPQPPGAGAQQRLDLGLAFVRRCSSSSELLQPWGSPGLGWVSCPVLGLHSHSGWKLHSVWAWSILLATSSSPREPVVLCLCCLQHLELLVLPWWLCDHLPRPRSHYNSSKSQQRWPPPSVDTSHDRSLTSANLLCPVWGPGLKDVPGALGKSFIKGKKWS